MIGAGRLARAVPPALPPAGRHDDRPARHRRRPRGAQRGARRLRERGHPPAPVPRLRPARRRARAAASSTSTTRGRWSSASASCDATWPRSPRPRARRARSGCSATSTPTCRGRTSPRSSRSAASAGRTSRPTSPSSAGTLTRLAEAVHEQHFASGPGAAPAGDDGPDRGAAPHDGVPDHAPHDVLLRRRGHRLARDRPPGAACAAVAVGGVVRRRGVADSRRPEPRHRLLRQLRVVLPGDRAPHPSRDRGRQRGRRDDPGPAGRLARQRLGARPAAGLADDRGRVAGRRLRPGLGGGRAGRGGGRRTPLRRSAGTGRSGRPSPTS